MKKRAPHRGLANDNGAFAKQFVLDRLVGFEKDMKICLRPIRSSTRAGDTHAYFPALTACCGTLEYLAAMHSGRVKGLGKQDISKWCQLYMPQPDYNSETIRVLVDALRNSVAHRGIASGVWIDHKLNRRLTWRISEKDTNKPSINLIAEAGVLKTDPPWLCSYTHRVHISLKSLANDINLGAKKFAEELSNNSELHKNFYSCMKKLYPK